ncbi:restriction endonuclease subunit S [Streptomyces sp. SID3343]|uniref:restriction endonuclease subunit S n=1 Tax=Streptomyces sp. SID3343 TaxID=2690260 RepID=UPI00136BBF74|nr:restriction endonuclease subunit S [Streptomyces sp. SID3343]MYV97572.1 hypothetical protein [Streptomyces sp. SID3343]
MIDGDLVALCDSLDELLMVPGQVSRLRRTVLDLAISGQLVPNSVEDAAEYVSSVVERCKGSKSAKKLASVEQPQIGVDAPATWATTMLGCISTGIVYGTSLKTSESGDVPVLRMGNIQNQRLDFGNLKYLPFSAELQDLMLADGDILFNRTNSAALVGKSAVFHGEGPCSFASYLIRVRLHADVEPDFVHLWLGSSAGRAWAQRVKTDAIGQSNINGTNLGQFPLALPERAEQVRIVERVADLLSLIDEFEAEVNESEVRRRAVTVAACTSLVRDREPLLLDRAEELIRTREDINEVERTVFELAVSGRLTSSVGSDGLTSHLVSRARTSALDAADLVNGQGERLSDPYPLPSSWEWVPFGAVLTGIEAGWSPRAQARPKDDDEWGVLKVSACSWGEFRPLENKALERDQVPRTHLEVQAGDLLISRANTAELVGRSVFVDRAPPRLMLSDKTLRLSPVDGCNPRYLNLANLSPSARSHYEREATGTSSSMKNVSQKVIRRTPIPLPPRAEQDRIVAIVDELMGLLRRLRMEMTA